MLNNVYLRIIIGIFIGLPLTATSLIGGAHGLVLGYAGIVNAMFGLLLMGILTITGFIGIFGAWLRLLESTYSMSDRYRIKTRVMLYFGLVTSSILYILAIYTDGLSLLSMPFIAMTIGSVLFIIGTPKILTIRSNGTRKKVST